MTLSAVRDALTRVDEASYRRAVAMVLGTKPHRDTLYFIGNGGSAAIASHMAADFLKAAKIRAWAFNDAPLMSAMANDEGYAKVFSTPLAAIASPDDVLIAISSSGKSENILHAVDMANAMDMDVITLTGFAANNPLRQKGDVNFWVESDQYGVVEVCHHAILHSILDTVASAKYETNHMSFDGKHGVADRGWISPAEIQCR